MLQRVFKSYPMVDKNLVILNTMAVDDLLSTWAARDSASWWRYQMETFSALLVLCAGNSSVTSEFSSQRPVARNFDVFFDLRLNKRLSK